MFDFISFPELFDKEWVKTILTIFTLFLAILSVYNKKPIRLFLFIMIIFISFSIIYFNYFNKMYFERFNRNKNNNSRSLLKEIQNIEFNTLLKGKLYSELGDIYKKKGNNAKCKEYYNIALKELFLDSKEKAHFLVETKIKILKTWDKPLSIDEFKYEVEEIHNTLKVKEYFDFHEYFKYFFKVYIVEGKYYFMTYQNSLSLNDLNKLDDKLKEALVLLNIMVNANIKKEYKFDKINLFEYISKTKYIQKNIDDAIRYKNLAIQDYKVLSNEDKKKILHPKKSLQHIQKKRVYDIKQVLRLY